MTKIIYAIMIVCMFSAIGLTQNSLSLDINEGTIDVIYNSDSEIYGFQFTLEGATVDSAPEWSGVAVDAGYSVSTENNIVIGFSMAGTAIPSGCGTLITFSAEITGDVEDVSLSEIVMSGDNLGNVLLPFSYYDFTCGCDGGAPCSFNFASSTQFSPYYFGNVFIGCEIDSLDWVGAFNLYDETQNGVCIGQVISEECPDLNGDNILSTDAEICVGSQQWNTNECGGGICEIYVRGDEGSDQTEGYMQSGDIPLFKIYDASENTIYDAVASEDVPWAYLGSPFINYLWLGFQPYTSSDVGSAPISLSIENVDMNEGALDIYMQSSPACSYCLDPEHTTQGLSWNVQKANCDTTASGSTWIVDFGMSESDCADVINFQGGGCGGHWDDVEVMGFMFSLIDIDISDVSEGYVEENDFMVTSLDSTIIAFSLAGSTIGPGDGLLTHVNFSSHQGSTICFGADSNYNLFSDNIGDPILSEWGDCFCIDGYDSNGDCNSGVTLSIPIGSGWNWISLNVEGDLSINNVLSSLNSTANDFIKTPSASSQYYGEESGWQGGLSELSVTEMYMLKSANPDNLVFSGSPVDPLATPIALSEGWNWIGFTPQNDGPINDALASITATANDFIKTPSASSQYYGVESGWQGGLSIMAPTNGYMLKVATASDLIYPNFGPDDALVRTQEQNELPSSISSWEVDYHDFEFTGTLSLSIDNSEDYDGDYIGVFVGDECRGVAERMYFPIDGSYYYSAMVYSNVIEGDKLTFKYYNSLDDEIVDYSESLDFTENMIVGNGLNTFGLSHVVDIMPEDYSLSRAYPNPFNPVTTLSFTLPVETEVSLAVYNLYGREMISLINGNMQAGYHSILWDAHSYSSGVYFVKMIAGEFVNTQKLMLIK